MSLDLETTQIFLDDFDTDIVTVAFEETVLIPTRLAKVLATKVFFLLTVRAAKSAAANLPAANLAAAKSAAVLPIEQGSA